MAHVDLKQLVGRLNKTTRGRTGSGRRLCVSRGRTTTSRSSTGCSSCSRGRTPTSSCCCASSASTTRGSLRDLTRAIDGFRTGNSGQPALSPDLVHLIREAWLIASIDYAPPTRADRRTCCVRSSATNRSRGSRPAPRASSRRCCPMPCAASCRKSCRGPTRPRTRRPTSAPSAGRRPSGRPRRRRSTSSPSI